MKSAFPPPPRRLRGVAAVLLPALAFSAAAATAPDSGYADLSLEQLMDTQVTSVSKKVQKLEDAAAAVHVISQDDIRRSGMTSVPELLRMVPGLHVAQIDNGTWSIASRGFSQRWSDKLLVLLDGRVLYTPLFSGVYWDAVDTPLEDIERIEVIRGPGGTMWGANAVNGVINIVTKDAAATRGGLLSAGKGNREGGATFRYGAQLGEFANYRVWAKSQEREPYQRVNGGSGNDAAALRSAGFRSDWHLPQGDHLTFQGDAYDGNSSHTDRNVFLAPPYLVPLDFTSNLSGANLLVRWNRKTGADAEMSAQLYWDHYRRRDIQNGETRDTFDFEFQHRFAAAERHDLMWGVNFRDTRDDTDPAFLASFRPASRRDRLAGLFVQDEITLVPGKWRLTLGSKFEHNDYTGFEYQPSARLLWRIDEGQSAWAAVSRAVKTPSRADSDIRINVAAFPAQNRTTMLTTIFGNPNFVSEKLLAYEVGYRSQVTQQLFVDGAVFYSEYRDLRTGEAMTPYFEAQPLPHLTMGQMLGNKSQAKSRGFELSATWKPAPTWTVKGAWSRVTIDVKADPDSTDAGAMVRELSTPDRQWQFHVHQQTSPRLSWNTSLYHAGALGGMSNGGTVAAHLRVDARIAYHWSKELTLSLVGRNLAGAQNVEFLTREGPTSTQIPRSLFASATWTF